MNSNFVCADDPLRILAEISQALCNSSATRIRIGDRVIYVCPKGTSIKDKRYIKILPGGKR